MTLPQRHEMLTKRSRQHQLFLHIFSLTEKRNFQKERARDSYEIPHEVSYEISKELFNGLFSIFS